MLNKVILISYLGADPESKTMLSGGEVVNFCMAISESYTDKATNKKIDKTEWHSFLNRKRCCEKNKKRDKELIDVF
ncbi:hypothetical protein ME7_00512 [Bartonella birtlesii LL-WM9]|uniref:Single-stranded DNA-binding protein n=1 Tax=Bartonella birtlesii LL-WM9 TaxID=1094552 RepID=J0YS45_9HYPH|nr:hypothetical protein ME7_00512 [Bartonella birtlesii LL-WM9]